MGVGTHPPIEIRNSSPDCPSSCFSASKQAWYAVAAFYLRIERSKMGRKLGPAERATVLSPRGRWKDSAMGRNGAGVATAIAEGPEVAWV